MQTMLRRIVSAHVKTAASEIGRSELPTPQATLLKVLERRRLEVETIFEGIHGYIFIFQKPKGLLSSVTLEALLSSAIFRWLSVDHASAKQFPKEMGYNSGHTWRVEKDQLLKWTKQDKRTIQFKELHIGC